MGWKFWAKKKAAERARREANAREARLLRHAALLLRTEATLLRSTYSVGGRWPGATEAEIRAKVDSDDMLATAAGLHTLADRKEGRA